MVRHVQHTQDGSTQHANEDNLHGMELGLIPSSEQLRRRIHNRPTSLSKKDEHKTKIPLIKRFQTMPHSNFFMHIEVLC